MKLWKSEFVHFNGNKSFSAKTNVSIKIYREELDFDSHGNGERNKKNMREISTFMVPLVSKCLIPQEVWLQLIFNRL